VRSSAAIRPTSGSATVPIASSVESPESPSCRNAVTCNWSRAGFKACRRHRRRRTRLQKSICQVTSAGHRREQSARSGRSSQHVGVACAPSAARLVEDEVARLAYLSGAALGRRHGGSARPGAEPWRSRSSAATAARKGVCPFLPAPAATAVGKCAQGLAPVLRSMRWIEAAVEGGCRTCGCRAYSPQGKQAGVADPR
jgi:hypothetical protein